MHEVSNVLYAVQISILMTSWGTPLKISIIRKEIIAGT